MREFLTKLWAVVRILVVTVLVLITFTAFVAPIPASNESERIMALSEAPTIEGRGPKIGSFERECSFIYEGTKMRIVVSGDTYIKQGKVMIRYTQELLTFDSEEEVLSSKTLEQDLKLSDMVLQNAVEDINKPVEQAIPSSNWGTFTYYWWNGFKMIKSPGSTQRSIDYEHPDNYYYSIYHPEQWNLQWSYRVPGSRYCVVHHSQSEVRAAEAEASLWRIINSAIGAVLGLWAIFIPAAAVLALVVGALAAFLVIIGVYQFFMTWWIDVVLQAEQDDGFSYSYVWPDLWVSCSYGGWNSFWIRSYSLAGSV